ncbi:MAG: hypothetical protein H6626_08075 [Pseudobdellovibrionaceae bacterium]|nr:hypothetical protein [Bdellovibrionales bacterium]USN46181.1 MAG: hypothetical protein H6626_08075 [Pseudobdellovibrionaceae bacterium]
MVLRFFIIALFGGALIFSEISQAEPRPFDQTVEGLPYCKILLRGNDVDRDILGELDHLKRLVLNYELLDVSERKLIAEIVFGLAHFSTSMDPLELGPKSSSAYLYTLAPTSVTQHGTLLNEWNGLMIVMSDRLLKVIFDLGHQDFRFYYTKIEEIGDGKYFSTIMDSHDYNLENKMFKNGFKILTNGSLQVETRTLGFDEIWIPAFFYASE